MKQLLVQRVQINRSKLDKNSYVQQIPSLQAVCEVAFHAPVTFFAGENGSGKSTLLEAIAVAYGFNPEGGTVNYQFSTYDSHSELSEALCLSRGLGNKQVGYFLRAESFYNVASQEEIYFGAISQSYHKKSHGEAFLQLIQHEFKDGGLYLLDEPEGALSPTHQLTLIAEIHRLVKTGAQFIIATHSPILLAYTEAEILQFSQQGVHTCPYEETESYKITKFFLDHPHHILHHLLEE